MRFIHTILPKTTATVVLAALLLFCLLPPGSGTLPRSAAARTAETIYGDVTGDRRVTGEDARFVLRGILEYEKMTTEQRLAADLNGDGTVNAVDVLLIQWKTVGSMMNFDRQKNREKSFLAMHAALDADEKTEEAATEAPVDRLGLKLTRNLWPLGDQSFVSSREYGDFRLTAGEYVISAEISSSRGGTEAPACTARVCFLSGEETIADLQLSRNCRASAVFSLPVPADGVVFFASDSEENSAGASSQWRNIQIEKGDELTSYVPHLVTGDPGQKIRSNVIFTLADTEIGKDWTFSFVRGPYDDRNLIIEVESEYTGEDENPYVEPKFSAHYGLQAQGTMKYAVGRKGSSTVQQFRLPPIPKYTNQYKNTVWLEFYVPDGFTVHLRRLSVRYDDTFSRNESLQIDTHGGFLFYPEFSYAAAYAAARCGAGRFIVIPKCSSDGVWFAYHDDSFQIADTKLRAPDGSKITDGTYNGARFTSIPFRYLERLDWGIYRNSIFAGTGPLRIDELFSLCAETGMKPMFSLHPKRTKEQARSLRALAEDYGMLDKLSLKPVADTTDYFSDVLFSVFGTDIDEYVLILPRAKSNDAFLEAIIDELDACHIDTSAVDVAIELWIDKATPEQVRMILDAGYKVSLVSFNHVGPDGQTHSYLETDDYRYWSGLGVTEYTDNHNSSLGLNWKNY